MKRYATRHGRHFVVGTTMAITLASLLPGALLGQESQRGGTAEAASGYALEEVVVTARKREEKAQGTPLAISALSANTLDTVAAVNLNDISRLAPSVVMNGSGAISGSSAAASIFIRGVGQGDFIVTSDPGVGVYIDGVYYARMVGAALELNDIERVEVLRGPQGTLFGRNTIGGAISVYSRRPGPDFGGSVSLTAGENSHFGGKANVNIPLGENLYASASALRRVRGGYVKALQYGSLKLGNENVTAGRGQLRYLKDGVDLNFSADYTRQNDNGAPWVGTLVAPGADPGQLFAYFANVFTGDSSCLTVAGQNSNPACFGPVWQPTDRFATNNTFHDVYTGTKVRPYSHVTNSGLQFAATIDFDQAVFKSITAYRKLDSGFTRSLSHTPLVTFQNTTKRFDSTQFSQELQLTGNSFGGRLDWVVGFYYFREDAVEVDDLTTSLFRRPNDTFDVRNQSLAFLVNGTYHITDRWHLTGGARWTDEDKVGDAISYVPGTDTVATRLDAQQNLRKVTPSVNLAYNLTPDILGYINYSKGFKSGTFSPRIPFPELEAKLPEARPEFVDSYEAGLKSELLGHRLRLNMAAFLTQYDDIQVDYQPPENPANTIAGNAAKAEFKGVELDVMALPTANLTLTATATFMDSGYTSILLPTSVIKKHTPLQRAPRHQSNLGAEYKFGLPAGHLLATVNWTFMAKQALYSNNEGKPFAHESAWNSGDVSIAYVPPGEKWKFRVYGQNITDDAHRIAGIDVQSDTFAVAENVYNRPREFFATFSYDF
jgi:iron complex outermembrane receptor protein